MSGTTSGFPVEKISWWRLNSLGIARRQSAANRLQSSVTNYCFTNFQSSKPLFFHYEHQAVLLFRNIKNPHSEQWRLTCCWNYSSWNWYHCRLWRFYAHMYGLNKDILVTARLGRSTRPAEKIFHCNGNIHICLLDCLVSWVLDCYSGQFCIEWYLKSQLCWP